MATPRALGSLRTAVLAFRPKPERCLRDTNTTTTTHHLRNHIRSLSSHPARRLPIDRESIEQSTREISASRDAQAQMLIEDEDFTAAPEIDFSEQERQKQYDKAEKLLRGLRIVPESPSYFTAKPNFTDDYLMLQRLLRRYITLPTVKAGDAPRVAWRALDTYRAMTDENVRSSKYKRMVDILKRMNLIHPQLMPVDAQEAMEIWKRDIQPFNNRPAPILIDEDGRAAAVGRRKSSSAKAWVVEGEGEVLINGKPLHHAFARVHDRESVIWALKATQRVDKYNVWATVHGGGTTGQAEALTLAISKALMAHEPLLKPALRRAGCVARDPRRVERKKPGKRKARAMPAWVKR